MQCDGCKLILANINFTFEGIFHGTVKNSVLFAMISTNIGLHLSFMHLNVKYNHI